MSAQPVLINDEWTASSSDKTFQSVNPATCEALPEEYPVSEWSEIETALQAASQAARQMRGWPGERFAAFLEKYADQIESRNEELVESANRETALPVEPRLKNVELPRTTDQLRQAASAARSESWSMPTIDSQTNIRSVFGPIGPVAVFGPNNFPFAFNSIAGGDFAAAVAAGNPVIAKGHSSHPGITRLFAEAALEAAQATQMPPGFVQLIYRTSHEDGCRMVGHPLIGASGYTGARTTGLILKAAADKAGKPIYLELSSINPVFVLNGALQERSDSLADDFTTSCLMGTGQFCTNPGVVVLETGTQAEEFVQAVSDRFSSAAVGTMLSQGVQHGFKAGIDSLIANGAELLAGGEVGGGKGFSCNNTVLRVTGDAFVENPEAMQTEAFGNGCLFVLANSVDQLMQIAELLEGNLTGCIYSDTSGSDDESYERIAPILRTKVGRLLNDKMPTGVAVSAAMNHGGPFPATGHPAFTSVGMPTSIHRFATLQSYDNVRPNRLPAILQDQNSIGALRLVNGEWTRDNVGE